MPVATFHFRFMLFTNDDDDFLSTSLSLSFSLVSCLVFSSPGRHRAVLFIGRIPLLVRPRYSKLADRSHQSN